jgi:hypothetical protein
MGGGDHNQGSPNHTGQRRAEIDSCASKAEFLIGLANKEVADVTKALERNWTVHLILAGVGVALVFDVGGLPKFLSKYVSQDSYDLKPAATIILAVLVYHFARFGQLLSAFVESRRLVDTLLERYVGAPLQTDTFKPLRETTSYFEGYYSASAFGGRGGPVMTLYYLASGAVIATGQAAALALIIKAYGLNRWSVGAIAIAAVIMGVLYWGFWRSKKEQPGTKLLLLASVISATILFFAFTTFRR